jgi:hypothetical protein
VSIAAEEIRRVHASRQGLLKTTSSPLEIQIMESALSSSALPTPRSPAVWTGRVLTGLIVAFLLVDAVGKLIPITPAVEGTLKLGFAVGDLRPMGTLLAICTVLHLIPRTQFVGALLVTAYLGAGTAALVRVGTPFWFPVLMGILLWVAYALRSATLRALLLSNSR